MGIYERMQEDRRTSMKEGNKAKTAMLGVVLSEAAIKTKTPDDETVFKTIRATAKVLRDVQETIRDKPDREMEFKRLDTEIKIIESYLPIMISADEVTDFIASVLSEGRDVGTIMKKVKDKFGSKANMAQASAIAKAMIKN